ncbi:thiamine biosynthesis lipoprotein ApbE [Nitrospira sp.]|nr:thiamine biosynthesis lipoprotein ApbE [Nitrospira sp.]
MLIRRMGVWAIAALSLVQVGALDGCRSERSLFRPSSHALVKRAQMHMGTLVTLTVVAPTHAIAQEAVAEGFTEIRRLEALWSAWIPTSEISQVNASAGRAPVSVSEETMILLRRSMEVFQVTEGGFNIALGPVVDAWGISREPRVPGAQELDRLRSLIELSSMQLDPKAGTVYLPEPGMRIDIGGIGKGYAADLTAAVLRNRGATAGVVALAGDIKTFGDLPDEAGFSFAIQHPRKSGAVLARLNLKDDAVSTAGDYERFFEQDGVVYHHILDPNTLRPARGCQSVTIVAKEGVWADGLDTGIFVLGPERGMALIESLPDVEGVIVDAEGRVSISSGLQGRVQLEP